ncbi:hypothetical protein LJC34_08180 [Oscillospiraceae bacterium OttesenSCG-928-G22]|nr:hypothetical protein [Oscillospiraceae bacterium OttesenSCG-928-G22]
MFQAPKLTNAGKDLYYRNMAGEQITFTTIQMGSGTLSGSIAVLMALVTPVVVIDAALNKYNDYVDVAGTFSNAGLTQGFYWREIGVFAANPDDPDNRAADILYCYQNAYDTADFIPAASVETIEKNITVPIIVGDAAEVSCTLSSSQILVTKKDLEEYDAGVKEELSSKADLGSDGKLPRDQLPALTAADVGAADTSLSNVPDSVFKEKAAEGGVATLGEDGKIPAALLPVSMVSTTLAAASWSGSAAPYAYTLAVAGVTATSTNEVLPPLNPTAAQLEALQAANLQDGGQSAGQMILKAYGEKPTVNLPVRVIVRREM